MGKGSLNRLKAWGMKHKGWIVIVGAGLLILGAMSLRKTELLVTAHTVETGPVRKIIEASAAVESTVERTVAGQIAGEVLEVLKAPGDSVATGDVLAILDVKDLELSIVGLQAQKASLAAALRDAENPTPEALRQAKAQMDLDTIELDAARRAYEQTKSLFESGAESAEALKTAEEKLRTAEHTAAIGSASYDALRKGISAEQRKRFQADLAVLQAQIDQVKLNRDKFKVLSPVNGVVTAKSIEPGTVVGPGTVLFEIDDPSALRLTSDLLVQDAVRITVDTPVRAYDTDSGIEMTGKISKIYPKAFDKLSDLGIEQKRVRIEISIDPGAPVLTIGMDLDLEIVEKNMEQVLNVPDSAVFRINEESHVFRISDGKALLTPVVIGLEGEDSVEILEGLTAGDQVIDAPGNDLADGMNVKIEQ